MFWIDTVTAESKASAGMLAVENYAEWCECSCFKSFAMQAGIAPTMWEQSTWKNSIEDAAGHCARQILLQTPIMAAAQDFVQLGRLHTSSRTHTTAGAQTAWKSGITGTHTSGYKAKQAGEQYAATVMQSSPSYKLPYAVAQPTSRFPSASYALRD